RARERQDTGLDGVLKWPVRLPDVVTRWGSVAVAAQGTLLGDLFERLLGVLHHRWRNHVSRISPRRGLIRLVPAYRAFAWCSAGASKYCVRVAGYLAFDLAILRELARRAADGKEPI